MAPSAELTKSLLDCHYSGDPAARFAWLGLCEDSGVELPEFAVSGAWVGTLAEWMAIGPDLVQEYPLLRVRFSDREPAWSATRKGYLWFFYVDALSSNRFLAGPEDLPAHFEPVVQIPSGRSLQEAPAFASMDEALEYASSLAIQWARREGGCDGT